MRKIGEEPELVRTFVLEVSPLGETQHVLTVD
jgi:hypothetical protein